MNHDFNTPRKRVKSQFVSELTDSERTAMQKLANTTFIAVKPLAAKFARSSKALDNHVLLLPELFPTMIPFMSDAVRLHLITSKASDELQRLVSEDETLTPPKSTDESNLAMHARFSVSQCMSDSYKNNYANSKLVLRLGLERVRTPPVRLRPISVAEEHTRKN